MHKPQPSALDSCICFSPSSILGASFNLRLSLKVNLIFYPHVLLILHPHLSYHIAVVFGFASASIATPNLNLGHSLGPKPSQSLNVHLSADPHRRLCHSSHWSQSCSIAVAFAIPVP